ncbi:MAG: hypothetical protein GTO18_19010 [Anaerolineales bacterium]|nr:hypothetical protein [Anaerolineales bacterium]
MANDWDRSSCSGEISHYEITVFGELDSRWSEWFSAIKITIERSDDRPPLTTLHCPAMDQSMLRGVINKIWDMNLNLVSVRQIPTPRMNVESWSDAE